MKEKEYKLSIGISKQERISKSVLEVLKNIWYNLSFWRKWECIVWDIRFVQIKWVEQTSTSLEYWDIDAFIIWSDIAWEIKLNLEKKNYISTEGVNPLDIEELLDFEKSKSRFCLLLGDKIDIDENKKLSEQFDFLITKYPNLAKKYIWDDITIKKSESDSELLAKRFWVISFEIVQSWETAKQNGLDILWETREINQNSELWKIIKNFPKNSIRVFWKLNLSEVKKELIEDFVINVKSVLDAEKYDLISFNIKKDNVPKILELFPSRYPNSLETNNPDYVTLRILLKKYDISSITKIRKIWARDILVEPLRQVY